METLRSFIDGAPFAGGGETIDNINPANGEPVCRIELADEAVVEAAVEAAKRGFEVWKNTPSFERGRVLMRAAALLRARNDELAKIEMTDTGKPISESLAVDIESAAEAIEYYGGLAPAVCGRQIDLPGALAYVRREPLGVCVGVGAWNYPLQIAGWKSALALACGNAMIFKPSEMTPTTALELAKIYIEAGLPRGVFNVALGDSRVGATLVKHPGVAKVSLTGAAQTGKTVMALAAATLKNVTFELGGKSPLIVFADSDLDEAVSGAMLANFYTQGEVCSNGTRVFLHKKIAAPFLERIVARADKMKIGDPADPRTQIGALISAAHARKVAGYIEAGRREGAALLCGGEFATDGVPAGGHYCAPTVFADCADGMSIVREEIFGPVLSALSFEDEDEVVARANDTDYGLAAGVFTRDIARAHRVVHRLDAGTCWINNFNITPAQIPFGGVKHSGIGAENGPDALDHYSRRKTVYVELGKIDCPYD